MVPVEELRFLSESNKIEGVYDLTSFDISVDAWQYLKTVKELTLSEIKHVHSILMNNDASWSEPQLKTQFRGKFRNCPVYIGGREALAHYMIENELQDWCDSMNSHSQFTRIKDNGHDNFEDVSKTLHVIYERIHPFIDGNGRTGRMFMNWWRLRQGMDVLVIHEGREQMEYYKWFKENII